EGLVPAENSRWFAVKLFERDEKVLDSLSLAQNLKLRLEDIISELEKKEDDDAESIITNERYSYIAKLVGRCLQKKKTGMTTSDKIDRIVTNRWLALPIFAVVMTLVYYISWTTVGTIVTDFTNDTLFGEWISPAVENFLVRIGTADWLVGLIVEGIVGGVGAVLGFVPQMLVLFLLLCLLEDCGYMARVAFIMDRIFRRFGLSGKSFIPMLIGTGCGVPGIMASRTIEQDRDRKMTIMTTTFIPCGAKMPIVGLIACILTGFCVSMLWPGTLIYTTQSIPQAGVAVYALLAAGGDLGGSIAPQLMGSITDAVAAGQLPSIVAGTLSPEQAGFKTGMLIAALFPLVGIIVVAVLRKALTKAKHQ
ncbi:MAG: hypothetical protein KHW59_10350, partial [Clostridiales bacterium]|nr:hypothetical protein [Clostridiales bacterium]